MTNFKKNMRAKAMKFMSKAQIYKLNLTQALCNQRGETSVGQAVAILTAVVIGALLLAGLYMLFEDVVLVELTKRIKDMFDYAG